jgi:hypothetical protein
MDRINQENEEKSSNIPIDKEEEEVKCDKIEPQKSLDPYFSRTTILAAERKRDRLMRKK